MPALKLVSPSAFDVAGPARVIDEAHMTTATNTDIAEVVDVVDESAPAACSVCQHELSRHDAISLRFCQASESRALTRNCICPPARA